MDHLYYFCLVFVLLSRLFIAALWSPAGEGVTSWFLFVILKCFCHNPMWYPGSGVDHCHLIVAISDLCRHFNFIDTKFTVLSLYRNEFTKFNKTGTRM